MSDANITPTPNQSSRRDEDSRSAALPTEQPGKPPFDAGAGRPPSLINRIVATSLNQRLLVVLLALLLVVAGVWSFTRLPVDAYPDLAPPIVEVITQWPGHASEEVERLITVPVEVEMNGLPRLQVVRSVSLYGLSVVTLTFTDGTDLYFARQQVFERLPDVEVPETAEPSVGPLSSPSGLVYRYVLQSPDRSPMGLKNLKAAGELHTRDEEPHGLVRDRRHPRVVGERLVSPAPARDASRARRSN